MVLAAFQQLRRALRRRSIDQQFKCLERPVERWAIVTQDGGTLRNGAALLHAAAEAVAPGAAFLVVDGCRRLGDALAGQPARFIPLRPQTCVDDRLNDARFGADAISSYLRAPPERIRVERRWRQHCLVAVIRMLTASELALDIDIDAAGSQRGAFAHCSIVEIGTARSTAAPSGMDIVLPKIVRRIVDAEWLLTLSSSDTVGAGQIGIGSRPAARPLLAGYRGRAGD